MTESLQEIERLVADLEYAVEQHRGDHNRDTVANRASAHHALLSAITRVVQERKELEDRVAALVKCIDQDTESMAKDEARIAELEEALRGAYDRIPYWRNNAARVLAWDCKERDCLR